MESITEQAEILLPAAVPHGFDYRVPAGMALQEGDIVTVPFGRGQSLGVVWGKGQAVLPASRIKPVITRHEFPPLSPALRQFIDWSARYNCAPAGAMLKMVLPVNDIDKEGRIKMETGHDLAGIELAPLSDIQKNAAETLKARIGQGFSVTLLDGVTGSGKTEVYFDAIAQALQQGQVLVLLPEIALSIQWLDRFKKRFGFAPVMWNSGVTAARKRVAWQAIARGEAPVVIGARSALFLPYPRLALLVVDEEHDSSYKQEDGAIYHARDMAVARARFEKLPVVLVSATPSLESYHNVRQGKYGEISLPSRYGEAKMPTVQMLDMRKVELERGAFISEPLKKALGEAIASGHQAMLFLNRRGYAPLLLCRACGYRFECPECSAWMVLHKGIGHQGLGISEGDLFTEPQYLTPKAYLQCHHCNHRQPLPSTCPACHAEDKMHACGPGVERVKEEAAFFLPQARIAVMASDNAGENDLSDTIAAMEERRIDLLIGTQMIAKGHHFAGLAVVGVVDADLGLGGGDLRAAERTYQLLHQLSGRAGRETVPGTVYLQSFQPEHLVMKALLSGDRETFLQAELGARQRAKMPPFSRLAAIIVEGPKEEEVMKAAKILASVAGGPASAVHVLGPAPAPLYRLSGRYRYRLLLRAERNLDLSAYARALVEPQRFPASVRVKIDIDPVSFL
ncbi:MAG: primosomal protein N' [Pseudomonadota bacterium]|nr:primosomal protein N' [Pseudomonadota bacterium]